MKSPVRKIGAVAALSIAIAAFASAAPASAAPYSDQEYVSFTAGNGQQSQYHVYAAGVPQPSGLFIWTHGDGAWEFSHPNDPYVMGGADGVRAKAKAEGYIVVSALAPDTTGTVTWWENGKKNADYMADLIDHLKTEYDIDSNDIVLAGFSGGAQFTTQYFLPEYSGMLEGGGSIVFGGGGAPETPDQQPWNQDLKSNFFMHWATGEFDDLEHSDEGYDARGYAQEGIDYYTNNGFNTSYYWIPGKDHVIDELFGGIVGEQLALHGGTSQSWSVSSSVQSQSASVTVTIPPGTTGTTRVMANGPGGTYWYEDKTGSGPKTFQLGDSGDLLTPGTTYTFTVTNGGTQYASGSFTTTGTTWVTTVDPDRRYAYITVTIPAGSTGTTRVRANGPGGSYWYVDKTGTGQKTFQMGDPGDRLSPGTAYTYTVTNGGIVRASGSFTTDN